MSSNFSLQMMGLSAAQSSTMQCFDAVFGVKHEQGINTYCDVILILVNQTKATFWFRSFASILSCKFNEYLCPLETLVNHINLIYK